LSWEHYWPLIYVELHVLFFFLAYLMRRSFLRLQRENPAAFRDEDAECGF
jgi:hypothetical protein